MPAARKMWSLCSWKDEVIQKTALSAVWLKIQFLVCITKVWTGLLLFEFLIFSFKILNIPPPIITWLWIQCLLCLWLNTQIPFISHKVLIPKYSSHHDRLYFWVIFLNQIPKGSKQGTVTSGRYTCIDHILKNTFNSSLRQKFYLYFNIYVLGIPFKENNLITLSKDLAPETVWNIICQATERLLCNSAAGL